MAFLISREFYLIGNTNTFGNLTIRIVHVRDSTSAVSLDLQHPWFLICITVGQWKGKKGKRKLQTTVIVPPFQLFYNVVKPILLF